MRTQNTIKRTIAALVMTAVLSVGAFALSARPAHALLGVGDVSITIGDIPRVIAGIVQKAISTSGSRAFQQALRSVSYRLAQDTAVWIAAGSRGKKPLIFQKSWTGALKDIGDEVAGKTLVNLSKGFPVNLCSPGSIQSQLAITIGVSKSLRELQWGGGEGECAPGESRDGGSPGQSAKATLTIKNTETPYTLTEIRVSPIAGVIGAEDTRIFSERIDWGGDSGEMAQAIVRQINTYSADFVATGGSPDANGNARITIADKQIGTRFNGKELTVLIGDGSTGSTPEGTDGLFERTTFSGGANSRGGYGACINRDLGAKGCTFSTIKQNLSQVTQKENWLVELQTGFEPRKNELGSATFLIDDLFKQKQEREKQEEVSRAGESAAPVTDATGQFTTTPGSQVEEAQNITLGKALTQEAVTTGNIFVDTFFVFLNTLSRTYLQRLQRGFYLAAPGGRSPDSEIEGSPASKRALLASYDAFSPSRAVNVGSPGEIDLFGTMSTCLTDDPQFQTPYHCLLNDGLQRAIQQKLTVRQAVEQGYISRSLQFPETHQAGEPRLSAANLKKLRFMRVIPLGWELAAEKIGAGPRVAFGTLLDGFNDPTSPYYRLVDPSWVLELPQQFCRAQGWSDIPVHAQSPARSRVCVDLQSCVKESANGSCALYGYCTRERAVWNLSGVSCEPQFASCQTFTKPDRSRVSLLGSDVNASGCSAQNAGCTWYSTEGSGTSWNAESRVYLTGQAQACSASDAGSREVILLEPGVNLVKNGDFREAQLLLNASAADGGWIFAGGQTAGEAYQGELGAIAPANASQRVAIQPNTYYTLSFDASEGEATANPSVSVTAVSGNLANVSFAPYTPGVAATTLSLPLSGLPEGPSRRFGATFYSASAETVEIALLGRAIFDNIQLEEVNLADGSRAEQTVAERANQGILLNTFESGNVNIASPATAYRSYDENQRWVFAAAGECVSEASGSRRYTAVSGSDIKIARLTSSGLCSQQCNGLAEFLAMPTPIDLIDQNQANNNPVRASFIRTKAEQCSAAAVGCEEFTNLANPAAEQREYYSRIQSCVLDTNQNADTFYTWEGTDTAGFQLKAWQLLADSAGGPCTNLAQGSALNPANASCSGSTSCELGEGECRVFLDENGAEFLRDASKIVTASNQCTAFRRTKDQQTWHFMASEANKCSAAALGCREYKGTQANLSSRVLFETFEDDISSWSGGTKSGASDVTGGASYRIQQNGTAVRIVPLANPVGKTYVLKFRAKAETQTSGSLDLIRFKVGEGADQRNRYFLGAPGGSDAALAITDEWRSYQVGPVLYASLGGSYDTDSPGLFIRVASGSGGSVFIDNVELLESRDVLYAREQSTRSAAQGGAQPNACYSSASNFIDARWQSCTSYRDESRNTYYVSRFDRLFDESALSCRAVIDTQNSDSPYAETFAMGDGRSYVVPADSIIYRQVARDNARPASAAGCMELGIPDDPASASPSFGKPDYRKVDPDFAATAFCSSAALGCQAFRANNQTFYFRDPGDKLCAWNVQSARFEKRDEAGTISECTLVDRAGEWAAQCAAEANSCTAYKTTDITLGDIPLFYLRNSVETETDCTNEAIDLGCVNFDEGYSGGTVLPDVLTGRKNRLLSVAPGRECAEWLAPTTVSQATDPGSRTPRTVTHDLGRCQEADASGTCTKWVTDASSDAYAIYRTGTAIGALRSDQYGNRYSGGKTIFSGAWDYSGYSIPNQYPVELLTELTPATNPRLGFGSNEVSSLLCRSNAEEDAPYSRGGDVPERDAVTMPNQFSGSSALANLNLFEDGAITNVCAYKKVSSPSSTTPLGNVYYDLSSTKVLPDDVRSISVHQGWQGYCVEYDASLTDPNDKPVCAVWWPVDAAQAGTNIFDNHPEAGFASTAPLYYCVNAASNLIKYTDFGSTTVSGSPEVSGLSFVEAKNNNYIISVGGLNADRDSRDTANSNHFSSRAVFVPEADNATGLLRASAKADSPLSKLHEYDIESVIFRVRNQQHKSEWPGTGEEFILSRQGFAKSAIGTLPQTSDRWTALWCGGKGDANCDFGGEYSWEKFRPFLYEGHCDSDTEGAIGRGKDTNLFAIRARFANAEGQAPEGFSGAYNPHQFVGFESALCDNTPSSGWVDFQVVFQLREWCSTVAQVAQNGESKAWSARLNNYADDNVPSGICTGLPPLQGGRAGLHCYSDSDCPLDGTCNLLFNVSEDRPSQGYLSRFFKGDDTFQNQFSFNQDSAPFGSVVPPTQTIFNPEAWDSRADTEVIETFVGTEVRNETRDLEPGNQPLYIEKDTGQVRGGTPLACRRGEECILPPIEKAKEKTPNTNEGESGGIVVLRSLFAKVFDVWKWSADTASYLNYRNHPDYADGPDEGTGLDIYGFDFTGSNDAGQCPIVQAVRRVNSKFEAAEPFDFDADSNFYNRSVRPDDVATGFNCPAPSGLPTDAAAFFAGRYSVNGLPVGNRGDGTVADAPRPVRIGEKVSLEFYAFNYNGEQLPLREVYIDWNGDSWLAATGAATGNTADDSIMRGNFKNRRADCSRMGPNFGQTDRACEKMPFEFNHIYQQVGLFSPVVRVTDNWGKHTYAYYRGPVIAVDTQAPPSLGAAPLEIFATDAAGVDFNSSFDSSITSNRTGVMYSLAFQTVPAGAEPSWIRLAGDVVSGTHAASANSGNYSLLITATHTATGQTATKIISLLARAPLFASGWLLRTGPTGGSIYTLSDFDTYTDLSSGQAWTGTIYRSIGNFSGVQFDGKLQIQTEGVYEFELRSDDGSYLHINGSQLIDNGGDHAAQDRTGSLRLDPGLHDITVLGWNNNGPSDFRLRWREPGQDWALLPGTRIVH